MNHKVMLVLACLAVLSQACGMQAAMATPTSTPVVVVVTATQLPSPTNTPLPTNTPEPTRTPAPTEHLVSLQEFKTMLSGAGYTRKAYSDNSSSNALAWTKDNAYERIYTWEDGWVRLEVLNQPSTRLAHMDQKLKLLDSLFPADFMASLRDADKAYDASLGPTVAVSGTPDVFYQPSSGAAWNEKDGRYNVSSSTIGSYNVMLALWFWQITCPPQYVCWLNDFPGQEFVGDSSFVYFTIAIQLR